MLGSFFCFCVFYFVFEGSVGFLLVRFSEILIPALSGCIYALHRSSRSVIRWLVCAVPKNVGKKVIKKEQTFLLRCDYPQSSLWIWIHCERIDGGELSTPGVQTVQETLVSHCMSLDIHLPTLQWGAVCLCDHVKRNWQVFFGDVLFFF